MIGFSTNPAPSSRRERSTRLAALPNTVLGIALIITAGSAVVLDHLVRARDAEQFETDRATLQAQFRERLGWCEDTASAAAGLFSAAPATDREGFGNYVRRLRNGVRRPHDASFVFARWVRAGAGSSVREDARRRGVDRLDLPRLEGDGAAVVVYRETADPSETGFPVGADIATDERARAALRRACESGSLASAPRVDRSGRAPAFVLMVPVYEDGHDPLSVDERRAALLGIVACIFRAEDLVHGLGHEDALRRVAFGIYAAAEPSPVALLHASDAFAAGEGEPLATTTLDVAGSPWTVSWRRIADAGGGPPRRVVALYVGVGLIASLALYLLVRVQVRARAEAERANRLKDEFLATVSHELRTPLNAITGWAGVLRTGRVDAGVVERGLEAIERNAKVQTRLIGDLLDMSRIVSGQLRIEATPVDIAVVAETALETVRAAAFAKGVDLRYAGGDRGAFVLGDAARLQQVLWNLLGNAVKFTPSGGTVELVISAERNAVEVRVSDTGAGVDAEFLPFLFEKFRQAGVGLTRQRGGLGLGLAIVKHLVELHGGTVRASSEGPEQGTTFVVRLPRVSAPAPAPDQPVPLPAIRLENLRVVVVDDDPDSLERLRQALVEAGADVTTALTGELALERIGRIRPHVLVSDLDMPDIDGFELIRRVRALEREQGGDTPAIALAAAAPAERARALLAGFQSHVTRPFARDELLAAVAALARFRGRRPTTAGVGDRGTAAERRENDGGGPDALATSGPSES